VIFIILLVFMFKVMASSSVPVLGSPGALWDLLQPDVLTTQAYGAKDGSYLTMDSGGTSFKNTDCKLIENVADQVSISRGPHLGWCDLGVWIRLGFR
jgi:hypothetical protein